MHHLLLYSICYLSERKKGTKISDIYANMLPDINMYESHIGSILESRKWELGLSCPYRTQEDLLSAPSQSHFL